MKEIERKEIKAETESQERWDTGRIDAMAGRVEKGEERR